MQRHAGSPLKSSKGCLKMMRNRYVIDTNTIISALLLPLSIPRQAFDKAFDTGVILVSVFDEDVDLDTELRRSSEARLG